jgi:hypothetical protein
MAKPLPRASHTDATVTGVNVPLKTPAGVWVIVGMALLIGIAGLGTGAFIAFKSIAENNGRTRAVAGDAVDEGAAPPAGTTGVLGPDPVNADNSDAPTVVADPVEQDTVRQEVLSRIDLMKSFSQGDKDKLYAQVERARGFQKIAVIPFAKNDSAPSAASRNPGQAFERTGNAKTRRRSYRLVYSGRICRSAGRGVKKRRSFEGTR